MEFKKLEIDTKESWFKRVVWSAHGRKTILFVFLGALAGILLYMLEDNQLAHFSFKEAIPNMVIGAFFGLFITNSPCARNKC